MFAANMAGRIAAIAEVIRTGQADRHRVNAAKYEWGGLISVWLYE
jgi:hypothetical protein